MQSVVSIVTGVVRGTIDNCQLVFMETVFVLSVNRSGEQIGPYLVRERIGQGGMAEVYRAYQPSVRREVALKIIPLESATGQTVLQERFKQEAEVVAALEHPHILPVIDYGISDQVLYIAMRYVRGGTLRDLLEQQPLGQELAVRLFGQIAQALGYAHRRAVIHRDLKPSNILLDDEKNAYLADFGLAKMLSDVSQLTLTGAVVGTPAYMAPEQLRGDPVDHRADIYSLGVILYHMLVGRPPFEGPTAFSLIYQHIEKAPPPPHEFNPDLLPGVEHVLLQALQKAPADRFDTAEQMAQALTEALMPGLERLPGVASALPDRVLVPGAGFTLAPGAGLTGRKSVLQEMGVREDGRLLPWHRGLLLRQWPAFVVMAIALALGLWYILSGPTGAAPGLRATLLAGQAGTPEDVVASEAEVALARQALGSTGFIGYVICNQTSEFFATMARRLSDASAAHGLAFRVYDAQTDANEEIIQIERARTDGARALIVCVVDSEAVSRTLRSAAEDGLALVLHNMDEPPPYPAVVITHDDYALGQIPGRYAGQLVQEELHGHAEVVILDFPDLPSIVRRADGLEDGLLAVAPEAHIIGRYRGGTIALARQSVSRLLADGVAIDVILSINDAGAYGAIAALEQAGIAPSAVIVTGVDAEAVALQHIRQGYFMRATVAVAGERIPAASINAIVKQLAGGTLPQIIVVPPGDLFTAETVSD